jgi:hypothetical protein
MKRLLIPVFISLVIAGCGTSTPVRPTAYPPCRGPGARFDPNCHPTGWPPPTPPTVATSHPPMPSHTLTPKEVIDHQVGRPIDEEEDNHLFMNTVFRIAFYVFFGILILMQVYFAYRIRQSREQVGSDLTTDNKLRMSHKASFRFALFLTTYQIFLMIWAGYNIWTENISKFLGIIFIIGAIIFIRRPLALAREYRPVAVRFSINLSIQSALTDNVTPEYIARILDKESVIDAIKGDLMKTSQIGYKEVWRLGLITPDQDKFDLSLYQLPRQERLRKAPDFNSIMTFADKIPLKRAAVLHNPYYFNIRFNRILIIRGTTAPLVRGYPGWTYGLSTKMTRGSFRNIREIEIDTNSASTRNQSRVLPKFLQEDGFPLKESYVDGDPLTTERGGTITIDKGELVVIYPKYFVQRRLIDDNGNLVYLGLDEDFGLGSSWFAVSMLPSLSKRLVKCVSYNELIPIVRYRSFPYESDFMLPILDTPMSSDGWADLFIDPRGKAKLFVAKERPLAEWYEMMERLRQLFFGELAKKDYHLLGLTKDRSHLNHYLSQKQEILKDYYIIQDWKLT